MNIAKHMESIFVTALVVAVSVSNAFAKSAAPLEVAARPAMSKAAIMESPLITIVVVGKRLSAAQKAKGTA